jgi:outer membrane autotransporter protein
MLLHRVSGAALSRDALVAELGVEVAASENSTVSLGYAGQFGDGSQDHGLQARLAWRF